MTSDLSPSGVFDHPWLGGGFHDAQIAALWSPERQLAQMLAFEAAFSRAMGRAGLFDADLAAQAADMIPTVTFDMAQLRAGQESDGVVIPALVRGLKAALGPAGAAVHKGATSQDVIDTAMIMSLRDTLVMCRQRLVTLHASLLELDTRFGPVALMGRTRMQAATQITVGDRIAPWYMPLTDHIARIDAVMGRVAKIQLGGASGDRKALGDKADQIVADMARALDLDPAPRAWHAMRDGVAEAASVLSLITGTLGKMGQDICLMAQQGIGEITMSGGGGSSAMPHKQNPVLPELLVTLARFNAVQLSGMHQALIHEQERSGTAWTLEWMCLPGMAQATGRAVTAAQTIAQRIERIG
ncbi:3-carboxy-cis,cis-muconate cycloisomerase [Thioclava sp. SK-1]|uniref:3-carboxy-cis,cis-muconate cycloisomerase n=1 Tax=Thioclava sp. SK-1 TaxID=1889770 RepID=UPI000825BA4F|nr:3-carboxy-cis,cis-muconate cycloisomerase [Thioclava sp. SK-1]OCX67354.1 3-carboxy-cis,cis-muconate cycloisomerase [Thioclava sp. SK-1]